MECYELIEDFAEDTNFDLSDYDRFDLQYVEQELQKALDEVLEDHRRLFYDEIQASFNELKK